MSASKVPALDQGLRLLRLLASSRGPLPAGSLATSLGLARSTTYQLLRVMIEHGYVVHLVEARRYGLGPTAFELSGGFTRQQPLSLIGKPILADLVDRIGESGHLAVSHGSDVLYIAEERARRRTPLVTGVGVRLPAHLTATGRAILAAMPRAQVDALFPGATAFVDRTGLGPQNRRELRRLLADTAERGYAVEDGEVTAGLRSVAVPITDHNGWPVAGLGLTFAAEESRDAELVAELMAGAERLSRSLHGRGSAVRAAIGG
ncbi:IclR family transcriptional regulator [Mycetocola spongiae]|uniref:IclR family transcriptional regulator n=1 Tax=Mycetocola spongiae TaxID=2859226 RepID=UPI001CF0DDE4|nr:IclR family transcriptional regulator [Mycetocola spongiae]UCR89531.1 IclR family transcriptional regulator [Mycetocola spongiae]